MQRDAAVVSDNDELAYGPHKMVFICWVTPWWGTVTQPPGTGRESTSEGRRSMSQSMMGWGGWVEPKTVEGTALPVPRPAVSPSFLEALV